MNTESFTTSKDDIIFLGHVAPVDGMITVSSPTIHHRFGGGALGARGRYKKVVERCGTPDRWGTYQTDDEGVVVGVPDMPTGVLPVLLVIEDHKPFKIIVDLEEDVCPCPDCSSIAAEWVEIINDIRVDHQLPANHSREWEHEDGHRIDAHLLGFVYAEGGVMSISSPYGVYRPGMTAQQSDSMYQGALRAAANTDRDKYPMDDPLGFGVAVGVGEQRGWSHPVWLITKDGVPVLIDIDLTVDEELDDICNECHSEQCASDD